MSKLTQNLNKVSIEGKVVSKPTLIQYGGKDAVCEFEIHCLEEHTDTSRREITIRVRCFKNTAEWCMKYVDTSHTVHVEAALIIDNDKANTLIANSVTICE